MNEIELVFRADLDRAYPHPTSKPDWDDVLGRVHPPRESRRRRIAQPVRVVLASASAVAVVAVIVLAAPWSGTGSSFTARALAAITEHRFVRAVVEPAVPSTAVVDLSTGRERPSTVTKRYWYDSKTSHYIVASYVDGARVSIDEVLPGTGMPEPGFAAFVGGYRNALVDGTATVVGDTEFHGRAARLVSFDASSSSSSPSGAGFHASYGARFPGETEVVAVDRQTYEPLWYRFIATGPGGKPQRWPIYRIVSIGPILPSNPKATAGLPPLPKADKARIGQTTRIQPLSAAHAAYALGRPVLWPGPQVPGARLHTLELQRVTTSPPDSSTVLRRGLGVHLRYGAADNRLDVEEAAAPYGAYGFDNGELGTTGPVPGAGLMRVACDSACGVSNLSAERRPLWTGQLRRDGLYITLQSPNRQLLLDAARALHPIA